MAQALDAAWGRSLESAEAGGRQRRAHAEHMLAGNWLAAPPSFSILQRAGQGAAASGSRETEIGVAFPLWLPGQRQLNGQAALSETAWVQAFERASRWQFAAQLREAATRLHLAETEAKQAEQQRHLLATLSADVDRRVRAGELAPADALAAKAELLAARAHELETQQTLQTQDANWFLMTGVAARPEPEAAATNAPGEAALEQHPVALLAEAAVSRTRERLAQVQSQRGTPPEVGISVRQERPGTSLPNQNSVALSLRMPFGTQSYNQPQLAAALAEQDLAMSQQERMRRQLASELDLARSGLASSTAQVDAELERAALLRQRAHLLERSFKAGESSLPELLCALGAATQADAAAARQQAVLIQAHARLQQALGLLP